ALFRAGEMAIRLSELEQAGDAFERAISLYEESRDTHAAVRASVWLAQSEALRGRRAEATERLTRAYAVIAGDEPDDVVALLLARLGQSYWFLGDRERAAEYNEKALDIAEALRLPEVLSLGWLTRAGLLASHRPQEARGLYQLALDTAMANEIYG